MKKTSLLIRIPVFALGIFISSFGVALSAKADLGITPISSPPYVLSMIVPLTMGNITIIMHMVFIAAQILILRRRFPLKDLLQLLLAFCYGYFMDFSSWILRNLDVSNYPLRLLFCVLGVCTVALGVFITLKADVLFLAGEGLVNAIVKVTGKKFGHVKIAFDCSLLVFSVAVSFIFLGRLAGIREGTFIAAVGVGLMVQVYDRIYLALFSKRTAPGHTEPEPEGRLHRVVTFSREFDPLSMEIITKLSEITGLKLYDDELIEMIAREGELPVEYVRQSEDRLRKGLLQTFFDNTFEYSHKTRYGDKDRIMFEAQKNVIKQLAASEDCIIVGRNANQILGKGPAYFHIYLHAQPYRRAERSAQQFNISESQAKAVVEKADEQRRENYDHYLGRQWGQAIDYNLCLEITHADALTTARFLQRAIGDFTYVDEN